MEYNFTILEIMQELQTWTRWHPDHMKLAEASSITQANNLEFKMLILGWKSGIYDEDMYNLYQQLEELLDA